MMVKKLLWCAALLLTGATAHGAPTVTGNTISWPDDGWYQIQLVSENGTVEACQGGRSCEVSPGEYIVINHTTQERFEGIIVIDEDGGNDNPEDIAVTGNVISWPDDGWYQVQNQLTYREACSGTRSCTVELGSYIVINHTTGQRFEGIEVADGGTTASDVQVLGDVISWPDDGWYQVQDEEDYSEVCAGGSSCTVEPGSYLVINHSSGERFPNNIVGNSVEQDTVRVNFRITVPAYESDTLQLRLAGGDRDFPAYWAVEELWTATEYFPVNAERHMSLTFSDRHGNIILASAEFLLKTEENPLQVQLTADLFDTEQWDNDNDGVSNINELITGTNPLAAGSLFGTKALSVIFDIVGGNAVTELSRAVQALVLSTDGLAYPLLSTTPGADFDDIWTTTSDSRTYECPLFGTVQRSEYRREGWGLQTRLIADNCTDNEQAINGTFGYGSSWASGAEKQFTYGRNASLVFNDGASELVAEYMEQTLPVGVDYGDIFGTGTYNGSNISLIENGVATYRFGSMTTVESNLDNLIPNVWDIVTSSMDIDEIRSVQNLQKSGTSEHFTSGSFVGNKDGVQVLLIDADTGDENTFSVISTTGGSTISEIYDWSAYRPLDNFPLAD